MSDRILTDKEAMDLFHKMEMKYGAEMREIQMALVTDATVFGFITPATEARRQKFLKKILDNEQVKTETPPINPVIPPFAVIEAENVLPGQFGKDKK